MFTREHCLSNPEAGRQLRSWEFVNMLCPAEPADYFRIHMYPCTSHGVVLEIVVNLEPACHDEEVWLDAQRLGDEGFEPIPCTTETPCQREGRALKRKFIFPAGASQSSVYAGIVSNQDNTMFKYTFTAILFSQ